jgi:hypothetical protein
MPAVASSDYLLQIPPEKGEISPPVAIDSWSFGACNAGQCSSPRDSSSGMASGKTASGGKPNRASWDLATGKGARTAAGGAAPTLGDVDGDGSPDLAFATTQDEVYGLSFTFQKISFSYQAVCDAGHLDSATISRGDEVYVVSNAKVVCTMAGGSGGGAAAASYAKSGITRIDSTPARISTILTVGKQTQGATFGEKCASGSCDALTDGLLILRFNSGQMKHTKTGHVTLLK